MNPFKVFILNGNIWTASRIIDIQMLEFSVPFNLQGKNIFSQGMD